MKVHTCSKTAANDNNKSSLDCKLGGEIPVLTVTLFLCQE